MKPPAARHGRKPTTRDNPIILYIRLKDHSVTMSNGKWHWQSHGFGGETATALNYLIKVCGFGFVEAVRHLAGDDVRSYDIPPKSKPPPERKPFSLPPRNRDNTRVIAYLQSRGIEMPLILDCIERGSLYESATYHNCVFIGRDDDGKARFAAMCGTIGDFKCDADGSDKRFGFVLPPDDPNCDTVAVFEAPIDGLSHQTMTKIFTSMVSGEMTTGAFISKKEIINASIVKKNDLIEKLETRLAALTTGKAASEEALTKLYVFRDLEKLDRYSVDSLIDRILIHGDKNIEIVWNDRIG